MNRFRKSQKRFLNWLLKPKPLSHLLIALALLDLAFGFGLFLLPESITVQRQNTLVGYTGPFVLGNLLIFKGLTILFVSLKRKESVRFVLYLGLFIWSCFSLLAIIGIIKGNGTNIFSLSFFLTMIYLRYWILCRVGNERF